MRAVAASILVIAMGCARQIAQLADLDCDQVPGKHVRGTTFETSDANLVSAHLEELGQPVLHRWPSIRRIIRFTTVPTFGEVLVVSIYPNQGKSAVRIAWHEGYGDGCPDARVGEAIRELQRSAPQAIVQTIEQRVSMFGFPGSVEGASPVLRSADGALLEVICLHPTTYFLELREGWSYSYFLASDCDPRVEDPAFQAIARLVYEFIPEPLKTRSRYWSEEIAG
jgi:hypothetical protein